MFERLLHSKAPTLEYCQEFPFNVTQWVQLANNQPQQLKRDVFLQSLTYNPKSLPLWKEFLTFEEKNSNNNQFLNSLNLSIKNIGQDYFALQIYEMILLREKENFEKSYSIYEQLVKQPYFNDEQLITKYNDFLDQSDKIDLIDLQMKMRWNEQLQGDFLQQLKASFQLKYEKTRKQKSIMNAYETQLKEFECNEKSLSENHIWKKYLKELQPYSSQQQMNYLYQKALIPQCHDSNLWIEYFSWLENETGDTNEILEFITPRENFFKNHSENLINLWVDLLESDNPTKARMILNDLQKSAGTLSPYVRQIKMELRIKNFAMVESQFIYLIENFKGAIQLWAQIEYLTYMFEQKSPSQGVKYYVDLQNYQIVHFNKLVYEHFLKLFLKNCYTGDNYCEDVLGVMEKVAIKAKEVFHQYFFQFNQRTQDFHEFMMLSLNHLRENVQNIRLIKQAEKKLRDLERKFDIIPQSELQKIFQFNEFKLNFNEKK